MLSANYEILRRGTIGRLPDDVRKEIVVWLRLSVPIAFSFAGVFALQFVELAFLGHVSTKFLSSASIALIWINVTSAFLWQGFGNALSALVSQALATGQQKQAGVWLQQAMFYAFVFAVPIALLWWFTEHILVRFRFNRSEAALAGLFARWRILGLAPTTAMNLLIPFLQAQDVLLPGLVVNLLAVFLDAFLHAVLLVGIGSEHGIGFIGSPIASSITAWIALAVLSYWVFVRRKIHVKTWPGWNMKFLTWTNSQLFLVEQGLPAGIATSLEELQLEAISFLAARLGPAQISAHNSLLSLLMLLNAFAFGSINATTIRVGHYLGLGNVRMAKNVGWITIGILGSEGLLLGSVLAIARGEIPKIFSNDPFVIAQAKSIMLLLALAYGLVSCFFTAIGILQGQGRPLTIAVAFVLGAWMVGVPLAYVFSHKVNLGLRGLWIGIVLGYVVTTTIAVLGILVKNWDVIVVEVAERNAAEANENVVRTEYGFENPMQPWGFRPTRDGEPNLARMPSRQFELTELPGEVLSDDQAPIPMQDVKA